MAAEPLNDSEWSKFWELLAAPERSVEMHGELAVLHEKAQDHIDYWHPDDKAVTAHLVGVMSHFAAAIETLANILPAAGNLVAKLPAMKAAVENLSVALRGPAEIPPMPEPPEGYSATVAKPWPSAEQSAALGSNDRSTDPAAEPQARDTAGRFAAIADPPPDHS